MAATYKGLLTNNGKALIASATLNNKINYSHIAVGDGNGSVPNPLETRTALVNEKARIALNVVEINPNNTNQIICEAIIPSNLGGFYIRELGLYAGTTMVVNASYPPTYKPLVDEGGAREIAIKLVINIQNAEVIALYLDDSLIYATRSWVDTNYIRRNELVDNLTTNDAKKPLSAKQGQILNESKLNNVLEGGDGVTDLEHAQLIAIGEDVGRVYPSGLTWFQVDRKLGLLVGMTGTPYVVKKEKNKASTIVRILTENDNAPSASKLLTPRKINNVDFNGEQDISIDAPLMFRGNIGNLDDVDAAVLDGKYLVGFTDIAGLYGYGILVVIRIGGTCHQIYYPHLGSSPNNATMAMRQTWNMNGDIASWSEWRVVGTRDDSKLPLAGGTVTGDLRVAGISYLNRIRGDNDLWVTSEDETLGRRILSGGLLVSNSYSEANRIPVLGIYSKGDISTSGQIMTDAHEAQFIHTQSGKYLFINQTGWGVYSADGHIPLSVQSGGLGNREGRAPSADRLATPRNIFGQNFDGSSDIGGTVTASTGVVQADSFHYIDMGRAALDRMNFYNYGAIFNFIDSQNGNVVARITQNGIDCNAASASKVINIGNSAAYEGVGANPPHGLTLASVYHNGYPTVFGNVLRLGGSGQGEILVGWPGEDGGLAPSFMRGKRDGGLGDWTPWREIVFVDSLPSHNVGSATKLNTPRKINNVDFDGTSDITVTDDALTYMPIPYPKSSPPSGYLAMMGQAISESAYPKLYALYGAVLPDMRAYSVRGLDYGRGIDVGRTVLSQQDDAIQNIKGSLKASSQYDRNTQFIDALVADGAFSVLAGDKSYTGEGSGWGQAWGTEFDASRVVRTSTETRMKNIAFLYIVKAG